MDEHSKCCNACVESSAILAWVDNALKGLEVSDFGESYPTVRDIVDLKAENQRLAVENQRLRDKLEQKPV